ncbi:hypothetical protein L3Y34_014783 [Caenorhabditis briggsae]|uniref:Uncharacterized protein n=1 Tax=Caenorhabditis briggsae TaxID=6238 RepID=A0AAE9DUQ2_CAEBR|nr:hypothetical protein L3Y34_014783 [Caenorhabditis briggsae]
MSNGYGVQAASETTISDSSADDVSYAKPIGQIAGADFVKHSSSCVFVFLDWNKQVGRNGIKWSM